MNVTVRPGLQVNLLSTLTGAGSILLASNGSSSFRDATYAALLLGAGDQSADGVADTANTFSSGVRAAGNTFLLLGESSVLGGGSIQSGPAGTGTVTLGTSSISSVRVAGMRSGTFTTGAAITLHNRVDVVGDVQVVGGIDMTWAGSVNFGTGSSISVSPDDVEGISGVRSMLTLSGQLFNGFEKRGLGTLNLAHDNGTVLTNRILVENGVLLVSSVGAIPFTAVFLPNEQSPHKLAGIYTTDNLLNALDRK